MITYSVKDNVRMYPKTWKFPAGEVGVSTIQISQLSIINEIIIFASLTSSDEIMQLLLLTDALKRQHVGLPINLKLGYIPYARQDRVCNEGESLSIKVFADLINSQNYNSVTLIDPHSDVSSALFNNCIVIKQVDIYKKYFQSRYHIIDKNRILVAPDAGAMKKCNDIAALGNFSNVLFANKTRDMRTGNITDLKLTGNVSGKHVVVIDDIGDGMGTFVQLGNLLKANDVAKLDLIITHGIFTKGHKVVTSIYDNVYTTNSFHQDRSGNVEGVEYVQIL